MAKEEDRKDANTGKLEFIEDNNGTENIKKGVKIKTTINKDKKKDKRKKKKVVKKTEELQTTVNSKVSDKEDKVMKTEKKILLGNDKKNKVNSDRNESSQTNVKSEKTEEQSPIDVLMNEKSLENNAQHRLTGDENDILPNDNVLDDYVGFEPNEKLIVSQGQIHGSIDKDKNDDINEEEHKIVKYEVETSNADIADVIDINESIKLQTQEVAPNGVDFDSRHSHQQLENKGDEETIISSTSQIRGKENIKDIEISRTVRQKNTNDDGGVVEEDDQTKLKGYIDPIKDATEHDEQAGITTPIHEEGYGELQTLQRDIALSEKEDSGRGVSGSAIQEKWSDKKLMNPLQSQLLSSSAKNVPSEYPHGTTITLIVLLHLIFCLQWKRRTVKSKIQLSHHVVITKRKYHLAFWSYLSHVPTHSSAYNEIDVEEINRRSLPINASLSATASDRFSIHFNRLRIAVTAVSTYFLRKIRIMFPMIHTLKVFPQVMYISHLLWQLRSLEDILYRNDLNYLRLITVIMVLSIATKLLLLRTFERILALSTVSESFSVTFTGNQNESINNSMKDINHHFGSSSFTPIVTTLLVLYSNLLPHAPIQILPFITFIQLPAGNLGFLFCVLILSSGCSFESSTISAIARKNAQFSNVWLGVVMGIFFSSAFNLILRGGSYWINCIFSINIVLCALSLWVQQRTQRNETRVSQNLGIVIPCIDYVGWDKDGMIEEKKKCETIWREGIFAGEQDGSYGMNLSHNIDLESANRHDTSFFNAEENLGEEDSFIEWNAGDGINDEFSSVRLTDDIGTDRRGNHISRRVNHPFT